MIRGTGIEIIPLQDMQHWSEEEVRRQIWTPGELEYCSARRASEQHLAARYAAKLAILRALGIQEAEEPEEIPLTDIEIRRFPSGLPYPVLQGAAAARADRLHITRWHLSLTHGGGYAAAFVLAEGPEDERERPGGSEG